MSPAKPPKSVLRKVAGFAAKSAVTVVLLAYILSKADLAALSERLQKLSPIAILEIFALLVLQLLLVAERWRRVSKVLGVDMTFAEAVRIFWIGAFFTQGMPSSIGGDVIRVWFVRRLGASWMKSVSVIFADRIVALVTVIAITAGTLPVLDRIVTDNAPKLTLLAIALACLAGLTVLLVAAGPVERLVARWKVLRQLMVLALDIRAMLVAGWDTIAVFLMSCGVLVMTILVIMITAAALGVSLGMFDLFVLVPPLVLILAMPISFAGWGLREGVMIYLLGFLGIATNDSLAISITYGIATLLLALPGGIIWLASGMRAPAEAELEAVEDEIAGK